VHTIRLAAESASPALRSFDPPLWLWAAFVAGIAVMLLVDLFVLHKEAHEISPREAAVTSEAWIAIGLSFASSSGRSSAARPRPST
jgi:hypothetical protein